MAKIGPLSTLPMLHPRVMRLNAHFLALAVLLIVVYPHVAVTPIHWKIVWGAMFVAVTILPFLYLAPWEKASPYAIYLVSLLFISLALLLIRSTGDLESPFSPLLFLLCISHGTLYSLPVAFSFTTSAAVVYLIFVLPRIYPFGPLPPFQAEKVVIFLPLLFLTTYLSFFLSREIRLETARKEEKEALVQDLAKRSLEAFAFSSITALHHLQDLRFALWQALGKALDFLHQEAGFIACWAAVTSTQEEPLIIHRGPIQEILPQLIPLLRGRLEDRAVPELREDRRLASLDLNQQEGLQSFDLSPLEKRRLLYLPLTSHKEILGLLGLLVQDERSLTLYDSQFLQGIADQLSIAIDNAIHLRRPATIEQEGPQEWQRSFLLREASRFLPSSLSVDAILKALVDGLSAFLQVPRIGIFIFGQEKSSPYLYVVHDEIKSPPPLPYPIDPKLYPEVQAALQQDTILHIDDVGTHPIMKDVRKFLRHLEISSLTLIPIRIKEETVGLISIAQRAPVRSFSNSELELCQALAQQAGMAIENASLYFRILDLAKQVEEEKVFRQSLIESLASGLTSLDFDGRITFLNEAAQEILGCRREEVMGVALSTLIGEEEMRSFQLGLFRERASLTRQKGRWLTQDGRRISVEFTLSPHLSSQGEVLGAVISFQDVTQEELLREEMRRVERLASLGTMAAGIAHEIRNPLANIRIAVQALERKLSGQRPYPDSLPKIINEIDRLSQLLHDFLAFARPPKPNRQPTHLGPIIEEVTSLLRDQISRERVTVVKECSPDLPKIRADKALIQQVFVNLILNSIQAMPEGGEIFIQAEEITAQAEGGEEEDHFLQVRLRDTGQGIAPQDLERIFDPFYTTKPHGTGLGLSVVHQILREHEARIRAESEWGRGATFTIDFPCIPK